MNDLIVLRHAERRATSSPSCVEPIRRASAEFGFDDVGAGNAVLQIGRSVERDQLAVIDDGDAVAELVGFVHVMRGEENVRSDFSRRRRIISQTLVRETGSRPVVGSSRNKNLRRMDEAASDFEAAPHAAGKCAHQRFAKFDQVHGFEQLVDELLALGGRARRRAWRESACFLRR